MLNFDLLHLQGSRPSDFNHEMQILKRAGNAVNMIVLEYSTVEAISG